MSKLITYHPQFALFHAPYEAGTFGIDIQHFAMMVRGERPRPMKLITNPTAFDVKRVAREGWVTCDIETAPQSPEKGFTGKDPTRARLKVLGFGNEDEGVAIMWGQANHKELKAAARALLANANIIKVFHNGPWFDLRVLARHGLPVVSWEDTRDMRRAQSSTSRLSLGYLASIYDFTNNWKKSEEEEDAKGIVFTDNAEKLLKYNAQDCVETARVYAGLKKEQWGAREKKLLEVHYKLSEITAEMHTTGVRLHDSNRDFMAWCLEQSIEEKTAAVKKLVNVEGWEATDDHLRAIIYKRHEWVKRIGGKKKGIDYEMCGFGLPDPLNPKMYTDDTQQTISVDEKSLLLLIASGECPPKLIPILDAWWALQGEKKRRGYVRSRDIDEALGDDGRVRPGWNSCGTETMRFSCSEPPMMVYQQELRAMFAPAPGHVLIHADKCVAPDTKVLKADLTWVQAKDVKLGDELIGFDEELGAKCRMRGATVQRCKPVSEPSLTFETSKGSITCSTLHRWPVKRKQRTGGEPVFQWVEAQDIQPGDEIRWFVEPWETDATYDGAYLAGIYDGEGCVSRGSVQFTQNDGPIMDHVERLVRSKGFDVHRRAMKSTSKTAQQLLHTGQRGGLRFVGSVRPRRLLAKSRQMWEGTRPWGRLTETAMVSAVHDVGVQKLVALQTSTGTFIANGFMSHNSQLELRVMEVVANDRALKQALDTGDVYSFDARAWYGIAKDDPVKKEARKSAKIIHLGSQYGAGIGAIYVQALMQDRTFKFSAARLLNSMWKTTYCDTVSYWNAEMAKACDVGYSEGRLLFGRRTYPAQPELSEVANFPIQRTAAEMMNLELIELHSRLKKEVPSARIVIQLHDAIDVECREKDAEGVKRIMMEVMNREWTIDGRTRVFPVEMKVATHDWSEV